MTAVGGRSGACRKVPRGYLIEVFAEPACMVNLLTDDVQCYAALS